MDKINRPSLFDNRNVYYKVVEAQASVMSLQSKILKMNEKLLKKGAKYTHVISPIETAPPRKDYD